MSDGIDLELLRAKYRTERDRRIRPDGSAQYRAAAGEFGFYADDPWTPRIERETLHDRVDAIVIGGGFGGLLAGARLRRAGIDRIRTIEEAGNFGGTWYWNRYPGLHCDIESYVYLPLLEEVGYVPKWRYAPGEEIRQHAMAIGRTFDLYRDACFQTRVTEMRWDEDATEWIVRTDRGDEMRAEYVVVTLGALSKPKLPGIPGIENFRGHTFHTSRWDYGYTGDDLEKLAGKRVAVFGTGATGVQVVPPLAEAAGHLYVFQRTPSTVDVRDNRPTDEAWAASLRPGWQRDRMENFLKSVTGIPVEQDLVGDGWTANSALHRRVLPGVTVLSDEQEELVDAHKMNRIRARVDAVVADPATAEKLKPWYRYICKRPCFSDLYLQAFNRPTVTLVDTADSGGMPEIGTHTVAGYEIDCIIFATGYEAGVTDVMSGRMLIHGRDGVTLLDSWKAAGPRTLHGMTIPGFPNLFLMSFLHAVTASNFVHVLDEQARHIGAIVAEARSRAARYVEPAAEAADAWVATIAETAIDNYDFQLDCTPGFYNNEGRPVRSSLAAVQYGRGPIAFFDLLREWRSTDGFAKVLH
ncbi:monooxygenase [Actinoplanes sp. NBRC 14428]|nr:monooxygenase [Actinoplanes sp. NBRC 14428]